MNDSIPRPEFPEDFCGQARIFPLPNLVLFPYVAQPLLIFEPRYRAMLEEALRGDQLIGMALLPKGWDFAGEWPPFEPIICLSHVVTHALQDDGNYLVLMLGMKRARITGVLIEPQCPFRRAQVTVLEDEYLEEEAERVESLKQELMSSFYRHIPDKEEVRSSFERILTPLIPLGALADVIAFTLEFDVEFRKRVLAELNVIRRAQLVLDALPTVSGHPPFPPGFSEN